MEQCRSEYFASGVPNAASDRQRARLNFLLDVSYSMMTNHINKRKKLLNFHQAWRGDSRRETRGTSAMSGAFARFPSARFLSLIMFCYVQTVTGPCGRRGYFSVLKFRTLKSDGREKVATRQSVVHFIHSSPNSQTEHCERHFELHYKLNCKLKL